MFFIMRKFVFLFVISVLALTKGYSQYYNYGYGMSPYVLNDPCVRAAIMTAQSANRIYQQGYVQQMHMINNGWYNNNNNSNSSNSQSHGTKYVECDNCNGKGYNTKDMWMGGGEIRTIKINCGMCHGTGKVRK